MQKRLKEQRAILLPESILPDNAAMDIFHGNTGNDETIPPNEKYRRSI